MVGKKTGFLTEPRREFLKTPGDERDKKYSESQKRQFQTAISEQALTAIEDLILIARECDDEDVRTSFPPESIADLIDALMDRIGMDEIAGEERFFEVIVQTIEHRIHEKYREKGRFFKLEPSDYPIMPKKPAYRDVKAYTQK